MTEDVLCNVPWRRSMKSGDQLSCSSCRVREAHATEGPATFLKSSPGPRPRWRTLSPAILDLGNEVATTSLPYAPLVPFGGKLIAPSAFYDSFDQIHRMARALFSPMPMLPRTRMPSARPRSIPWLPPFSRRNAGTQQYALYVPATWFRYVCSRAYVSGRSERARRAGSSPSLRRRGRGCRRFQSRPPVRRSPRRHPGRGGDRHLHTSAPE